MKAVTMQSIDVNGRRISVLAVSGPTDDSPGLLWLPGYRSDMASTKATALATFATGRYAMVRFDYSGHATSGGRFEDGTIGRWLDETEAVFRHVALSTTSGPLIVIGSSMGGYLALLLLRRLLETEPTTAARIGGLVLIAPAWDMTEALMWAQFSPDQKAALIRDGQWLRPSAYGEPYPITRTLIEDGRAHLLADRPFDPGCPVHILQGLDDPDVPAAHTRGLLTLLTGGPVTLEEIPNGDHRLSRPGDIARLLEVVETMPARLQSTGRVGN
ncbi:MAG: alpha/beta hydrolase [Hyphomicrobium aestuarii]|nr:alpha/beta hydrolase [Hyphomicrobium aestuarii]